MKSLPSVPGFVCNSTGVQAKVCEKRMYALLILATALCISTSVHGQKNKADSVDRLVSAAFDQPNEEEVLWSALEMALDEDLNKAVEYTNRLMSLTLLRNDSNMWAEALRKQAYAERYLGNYVKAIRACKTCYNYYVLHGDTLKRAAVANQLGSMNVFMGYNEEAQKYLFEVYELYMAVGDTGMIAGATNGLAIFHSNTGQPEKAIERYREALKLYTAVDDTMGRANVHANLGLALLDENQLEEAEYHISMQGKLDSLMQTQWGLGFFFDFMGLLRRKQGRLEEAYQNHLTALNIRENLQSVYNINESRTNVADILLEMGRHEDAIQQAELILQHKAASQSLSHQKTAYSVLTRAHEALGNYRAALEFQKEYKVISDSIFNSDILETIAEKDAKFELAEQKGKIEILDTKNRAAASLIEQKNNTILIGTIGLAVFLCLSIILFVLSRKYFRQKLNLSKALSDKDILLREIHHRVKNNLQIVSSLLSLQSRSIDDKTALRAINEGKSRVRSMALIHQNLYQHDNLTGVNVKAYLTKLCQELFETYNVSDQHIALHLDIDDIQIDVDTLLPLGLIINELITNALKYAFGATHEGVLILSLKDLGDKLVMSVADNGPGYEPEVENKNSFGNKMMASLARQLNAQMKVWYDKGTHVQLEIATSNAGK